MSSVNFTFGYSKPAESVPVVAPGTVAVTTGTLSAGFEYPNVKFTLLTHGRVNQTKQKPKKKDKNSREIYSLAELVPGDYVVHSTHGIGIFEGIHKICLLYTSRCV